MDSNTPTAFQQTPPPTSEPAKASDGFPVTLRRNIYRWHRIIGLVTLVPIIFWCCSGLMHPFLSHWFKPTIAREFMIPKPVDTTQISLSLQEVLTRNKVHEFKNFRIVAFAGRTYYQVKVVDGSLRYYSAANGDLLADGDKHYAEFMARYFIDDQTSKVTDVTLQKEFSQQYKYINRYLPVWKVSFDRPDGMDVYIETASSRMGTFNTNARKAFLWVFDNFHNWSFLDRIASNTWRIVIMVILLGVILASAVSGMVIYVVFWKKFKNLNRQHEEKKGLRRYHRQIGVATAFIALTFTLSGAFHATRKLTPNLLPQMVYEPAIRTHELTMASLDLNVDWERVHNVSIVRKSKHDYFQVFYLANDDEPAQTLYFDAASGTAWVHGELEYAQFLGKKFLSVIADQANLSAACCDEMGEVSTSPLTDATLLKCEVVPRFESREYGFVFKRLPVVRLVYDTPNSNTLYVETSSSRLAASIDATDRLEGYSFAIFHKYLLMDWAGKNVRDLTMMLSAFGLLTVSMLGLVMLIKKV